MSETTFETERVAISVKIRYVKHTYADGVSWEANCKFGAVTGPTKEYCKNSMLRVILNHLS